MDLEEIIKAVENDKNSHILNLTTVKNHKIKINILSELSLSKTEIIYYMKKLKTYRNELYSMMNMSMKKICNDPYVKI